MKSKICGVSNSKILKYLINHPYPPQYIGFIVNYPKSKRYVELDLEKEILKVEEKYNVKVNSHSLEFLGYCNKC